MTKTQHAKKIPKKVEDNIKTSLDVAGVLIVVINANQKVTFINRKGCKVLECGEAEIVGKDWFGNFIPEEDRDTAQAVFGKLMSGEIEGVRYYQSKILTKRGKQRTVSWQNTVLPDNNGKIVGVLSSGEDITERKIAEEKILHLNLVLRAIRNVDRLIIKEKNPNKLIKGICNNLTETRGYFNTWIALLDESRKLVLAAESGLGESFIPVIDHFKSGYLTYCGHRALDKNNALAIKDPALRCAGCPLADKYEGRGAMTVRLEHGGKVYGLLTASIPSNLVTDTEERSIFQEVAGDIAFALHDIELKVEHDRMDKALKKSERHYRTLFDTANDGIYIQDMEGNIITANQSMARLTGYSVDELARMNISQLLTASSLDITMERQKRLLENEEKFGTQRCELHIIKKNGSERIIEVAINFLASENQYPTIQTIARDITEQKRAQESIHTYANQIVKAQEDERKRISRELHDETAQALVSLGMDINSLIEAKTQMTKGISKRLQELRNRTNDILQGVQYLSQDLRPSVLEELGLLAALEWLTDQTTNQYGINARFEIQGTARRLTSNAELALFRIAQEASNNVRKHSKATESMLRLEFSSDKLKLIIRDNGQGFLLPEVISDYSDLGKLGLMGMQERVRLLHGHFAVRSQLGKGTTIEVEIPG